MSKTNKKYYIAAAALVAVVALGAASTASAQTISGQAGVTAHVGMRGGFGGKGGMRGGAMQRPGVFGTVTAVDGTSISINAKAGGPRSTSTATTAFTVDASNATVYKDNATSSVSNIAVGDTIMAQGTVSGTSVTATVIRDGMMMGGQGKMSGGARGGRASSTMAITGNGEPVVAGTISSVSGSTIVITNKSNVQYTIDASNAKIISKQNSTIAASSLATGDTVVVQGTVNGNSIVATSVIDQGAASNAAAGSQSGSHQGFFGSIGSFFKHLFGF